MEIKELKKIISEKNLEGLYLFHGEEDFLKDVYINDIIKSYANKDLGSFNFLKINGKIDLPLIREFINTTPFMLQNKILILKNTELFSSMNKTNKAINIEDFKDILNDIPNYLIIIFVEKTLDKRLSLYKIVSKSGKLIEFALQKEDTLKKWVNKLFNDYSKRISIKEIDYFLSISETNMNSILKEVEKLVAYLGNREIVEKDDIDKMCTKTLKSRVFDLIDAIGDRSYEAAGRILGEVLAAGEPVQKIIILVERQLRILYGYIILKERKLTDKEIIGKIKIRPFLISKISKQAKGFSEGKLKDTINLCHKVDIDSKSGMMKAEIGLDLIVASLFIK